MATDLVAGKGMAQDCGEFGELALRHLGGQDRLRPVEGARLAECVTGIRLYGSGQTIRVSPDGREAPAPAGTASNTAPITLDDEEIGLAWLERPGPPSGLDDLLLERLAIAAATFVERYGPARTTMADPALVELVISADGDEAARARALRLWVSPPTCRSEPSPCARVLRSTV